MQTNVSLAPRTTLGLGGPAKRFVEVTSVDELTRVLGEADRAGERVLILGGGSNLVVGDAGFDGLVIAMGIRGIRRHDLTFCVGAGESWDAFVAYAVAAGLGGIECLSGIPGSVGATPMQNVGAYGQEVSDTIMQVDAIDRETHELVHFATGECAFAYRDSKFRGHDRWVITNVWFALHAEATPSKYAELQKALPEQASLQQIRDTVIALRRGKGMVVDAADPDSRSAGSFFTNPIVDAATVEQLRTRVGPDVTIPMWPAAAGKTKLSAGWLIERAGFPKGYGTGPVGISSKHALALVHRGGGTTTQLIALAREIQDGVIARLGIELHPEPIFV